MTLKMALGNKAKASTINGAVATNVLRYSETYGNAAWVKSGSPVLTDNAATDPRGTTTAGFMGETSGFSGVPTIYTAMQVAVAAVGEVWTLSLYVKPKAGGSKRYVQLVMGTAVFDVQATFDLEAGTVVGAYASTTARVLPDVGGWMRLVITGPASSTGAGTGAVKISSSSAMSAYTGDGTSGIYLWRMQMERGAVPTGAIGTTTAAASGAGFLASLPAANVRYEGRTKLARTASLVGSAVLVGNLTSSLAGVGVFALWGHNLAGTGVCTLELFDGLGQTGAIVYRAELVAGIVGYPCIPMLVHWLPSVVNATSWRVTFHDPLNAAGYVQAARVFLGEVFSPKWGADMGARMAWQDNSTQRRLAGGGLRTSVGARYRRASFELGLLTESERHDLFYALGNWGRSTEVLFSQYAGEGGRKESDHALLGKFTDMPDLQMDGINAFSAPLVIEEA